MIEFQLTIFMCSHCTRVHNAAHDCLRHEREDHAETESGVIASAPVRCEMTTDSSGAANDQSMSNAGPDNLEEHAAQRAVHSPVDIKMDSSFTPPNVSKCPNCEVQFKNVSFEVFWTEMTNCRQGSIIDIGLRLVIRIKTFVWDGNDRFRQMLGTVISFVNILFSNNSTISRRICTVCSFTTETFFEHQRHMSKHRERNELSKKPNEQVSACTQQ